MPGLLMWFLSVGSDYQMCSTFRCHRSKAWPGLHLGKTRMLILLDVECRQDERSDSPPCLSIICDCSCNYCLSESTESLSSRNLMIGAQTSALALRPMRRSKCPVQPMIRIMDFSKIISTHRNRVHFQTLCPYR